MKTQEVLTCEWNYDTEEFDKFSPFLSSFGERIEKFFSSLKEEEDKKKFYEVYNWDIGQLHQFQISKYWSKDQNPNPEFFEWEEWDPGPPDEIVKRFCLTQKAMLLRREIFKSCFVSGYWTIHQTKDPLGKRLFVQPESLLLFKTEEGMRRHLQTYPFMYEFCIDPFGVKHSVKTEIAISLMKETDEKENLTEN